jgi:hypothetical protein
VTLAVALKLGAQFCFLRSAEIHSTANICDRKIDRMQVFVPDFSVTKYFAVWTAAACCSFRLDSLLWTTVLNSIELSAS